MNFAYIDILCLYVIDDIISGGYMYRIAQPSSFVYIDESYDLCTLNDPFWR